MNFCYFHLKGFWFVLKPDCLHKSHARRVLGDVLFDFIVALLQSPEFNFIGIFRNVCQDLKENLQDRTNLVFHILQLFWKATLELHCHLGHTRLCEGLFYSGRILLYWVSRLLLLGLCVLCRKLLSDSCDHTVRDLHFLVIRVSESDQWSSRIIPVLLETTYKAIRTSG